MIGSNEDEEVWQLHSAHSVEPDPFNSEEDKESLMNDCLYWKNEAVTCTKVLMSGNYSMMEVYSCRDIVRTFDHCVTKIKHKYDVDIDIDDSDFNPEGKNEAKENFPPSATDESSKLTNTDPHDINEQNDIIIIK